MASLDISLSVDYQAFKRAIYEQLAVQLNERATVAKPKVETRVRQVVRDAILTSPEAASLQDGELHGELGVVNPKEAIEAVADAVMDTVDVSIATFRASGDGIGGKLSLKILPTDMQSVISIPEGTFYSKEHRIEWLKWLLTAGDQVVIQDYHFWAGNFDKSRTEKGIMEPTGSWLVPAQFSGTIHNNWLSRVLDGIAPEVQSILQQEMLG